MELRGVGPDSTYYTRLLTPPDLRSAQALFERATDYFQIATGAPPAPDEAARAFVAGPPSKSVDDKRVIGVFTAADVLIGVVDALVDWPGDGDWTMGMLLVDPDHRGKGLGSEILQGYERWAAAAGARRYHTAVVSHHAAGVKFLERAGYSPVRTVNGYDAGARKATIQFFHKAAANGD